MRFEVDLGELSQQQEDNAEMLSEVYIHLIFRDLVMQYHPSICNGSGTTPVREIIPRPQASQFTTYSMMVRPRMRVLGVCDSLFLFYLGIAKDSRSAIFLMMHEIRRVLLLTCKDSLIAKKLDVGQN